MCGQGRDASEDSTQANTEIRNKLLQGEHEVALLYMTPEMFKTPQVVCREVVVAVGRSPKECSVALLLAWHSFAMPCR